MAQNVTIVIRVDDQGSAQLGRIGKNLNELDKAGRRAGKGMKKGSKGTSTFIDTSRMLPSAASVAKIALVALAAAAVATGVAFAKAVGDAADFEKSSVQAASKVTQNWEEAKEVQLDFADAAKQASLASAFSANEAAQALDFLAMAGFNASQATEALPGVLSLAAAGNMELADAADIASNVLTGYGMEANQITKVNDVMVSAFTGANVNLRQMGDAFKYVGPVAKSAGVQFEEAAAATALLGNAGLQGEMGGTALRGAITKLLKPSGEAAATIQALGLNVTDSTGKFVGLVDIVRQLETSGATTADMMAMLGQRAGPGMQALVSQGADKLEEFTKRLEESGGTAKTIEEMQLSSFNGMMQVLGGSIETAAITVGEVFLPMMKPFVQMLTGATNSTMEQEGALMRLTEAIALGAIPMFADLRGTIAPMIPLLDGAVRAGKAFGMALKIIWDVTIVLAKGIAAVVTAIGVGLLEVFEQLIWAAAEGAELLGQDGLAAELRHAEKAMGGLGDETTEWLKSLQGSEQDRGQDILDNIKGIGEAMGDSDIDTYLAGLNKLDDAGKKAAAGLRAYLEERKRAKKVGDSSGAVTAPNMPDDVNAELTTSGEGSAEDEKKLELRKLTAKAELRILELRKAGNEERALALEGALRIKQAEESKMLAEEKELEIAKTKVWYQEQLKQLAEKQAEAKEREKEAAKRAHDEAMRQVDEQVAKQNAMFSEMGKGLQRLSSVEGQLGNVAGAFDHVTQAAGMSNDIITRFNAGAINGAQAAQKAIAGSGQIASSFAQAMGADAQTQAGILALFEQASALASLAVGDVFGYATHQASAAMYAGLSAMSGGASASTGTAAGAGSAGRSAGLTAQVDTAERARTSAKYLAEALQEQGGFGSGGVTINIRDSVNWEDNSLLRRALMEAQREAGRDSI